MNRISRVAAWAALAAAVGAMAGGCGAGSTGPPAGASGSAGTASGRGVAITEPSASPAPYGASDLAFGLNVMSAWCRQTPRANIVLSPASLASGLGMAYLGSRGSTASAMAAVLHLPAAGAALQAGLQARARTLRALDGPGVTVAEADQVWADPSLRTLPSYLNAIATSYDAVLRDAPLLTKPDQAAAQINAAIASATRGHITNLLSAGSLAGVGWLLTDALYLHAQWATPFEAAMTSQAQFTTAAGEHVPVHYLHGGSFAAATADGWTAIRMPYQGGQLAMTALLPSSASGSSVAGCPDLPTATVAALTSRLGSSGSGKGNSSGSTAVALPKVSLNSKANMTSLLSSLGMGVASGPQADFTGISPQAGSIGLIVHAATLQVDEQGTVASAATGVGISSAAEARAPRAVVFDRPYVLLVTDTATGEPLFLARVANPNLP
jgi:serine protease inhibitor